MIGIRQHTLRQLKSAPSTPTTIVTSTWSRPAEVFVGAAAAGATSDHDGHVCRLGGR